MIKHWSDDIRPGSAPPSILRTRAIPADEVLILSYTADLRFFERVCLPEARAAGARVTVVHDVAANLVPADAVHHAGVHYTDVPVRCRSDGEFHPKLLIAVAADRALVAIGSGNATSSGWHHNGELWTTIAADAADWPTTFHDLARWLDELPDQLYIDDFGRQRIATVAAALARHPAVTDGPQLLHNLHTSFIEQLPDPVGTVTRLTVASPFLDTQTTALRRLTDHFSPVHTTLALTENADADADTLTAWASHTGATIHAIDADRYFHGKLLQWTDDAGTHALVGSPNVTAAAMLRATAQQHGNCELAVLCDPGGDLTPDLYADPLNKDSLEQLLTSASPPPERDPSTPRLLSVLASPASLLATVVTDRSQTVRALVTRDGEAHELSLSSSNGRVHQFTAPRSLPSGAVCWAELIDGTRLGPVRVTDPVAVTTRPGVSSPLDDAGLTTVLSDRRLSDRLFQALAELASVRPPDTPGGATVAASYSGQWRLTAQVVVGSSLVRLALGAPGADAELADEDNTVSTAVDPGDAVAEVGEDDDATGLFDDERPDVDTGILDPLDTAIDPVSALIADTVTAGRLARAIDNRLIDTDGWNAVALLALMRVTLIVAAGGGWPDRRDAAASTAHALELLTQAPPADDDVESSRRAAVLVALAVIAASVERWDAPDNPTATAFERCRARAELPPDNLDPLRVGHYAADLDIGFGSMLTTDSVLEAARFLLTSTPVERAAESLAIDYPDLSLEGPRLLRIETARNPYTAAMRLLTRAAHLAPVAARASGPAGEVYVAWRPKTLVVQRASASGTPTAGGTYQLTVGPGAHTETPPRAVSSQWQGPLPEELAGELEVSGLWIPNTPRT